MGRHTRSAAGRFSREARERTDHEVRLAIGGEIDFATVEMTRAVIRTAMGRFDSLTVDLSELDFLSVAGIRMLAELSDLAERRAQSLRFVGADEHVYRLADFVGAAGLRSHLES